MAVMLQVPEPLEEAVKALGRKSPVGSTLRSAAWELVPVQLRETAQFSAGVESARVLQTIQDKMMARINLANQALANGKSQMVSRDTFINNLRAIGEAEGLTPGDPMKVGGLQDITSIPRLGLIFDIQQGRAQGFAQWKGDQTDGALMLYPAQEFLRVEARRVPRQDWPSRWIEAGGRFFRGRMIALKTDRVWDRLSRFGTPWPPFDFQSGMGLVDVDRDEAIALGVMREGQEVTPIDEPFTKELEASVKGLTDQTKDLLKNTFGEQIEFVGDVARWKGNGRNPKSEIRNPKGKIAGGLQQPQVVTKTAVVAPPVVSQVATVLQEAGVDGALVKAVKRLFYNEPAKPKGDNVNNDDQD
jgi:hypothetical protein